MTSSNNLNTTKNANPVKSRHSAGPQATAILAVYNSQTTIVACLESLLTQSYPLEIIVVDDGSTDNTTASIIRIIDTLKHPAIKLLKQNHQGPAIARNYGAQQASTDILLFVDADMTFDKHYVRDLIAPIRAGEVIGTYTIEERVANWDNVWARCWNKQEGWEDGKRFPKNPPPYGTDFRAIKRAEFERVGGFDHLGYTDTWSLFHKLGVRPLATYAICYHHNPGDLAAVYAQARWSAKRPYKFSLLGTLYALLRTSLPISLVSSLIHFYKDPTFVIFKVVYDWGRFVGILEMLVTGKLTK